MHSWDAGFARAVTFSFHFVGDAALIRHLTKVMARPEPGSVGEGMVWCSVLSSNPNLECDALAPVRYKPEVGLTYRHIHV